MDISYKMILWVKGVICLGNYVTLKELSRKLKIKPNTLYVWATQQGRLKYRVENRRILVEDVNLQDLLYEKTCPNCHKVFYAMNKRKKFDKRVCAKRYTARQSYRRRKEARGDL